ncbi:MAG: ssDNA-binding domain-containing protein [Hymenobacteraceae bacterium]|nr:ssDNA-binding domain-containing protein [Hymenobacteraceae bacterium]
MNAYQKLNHLAEQVTNEIIAQLQQGKAIWQRPWSCYGLPRNYVSGRHYEGFNAFYLHHVTEKHGFTAPYFLTFRQARELGGHVRKGQKGTPIVYWKVYEDTPRKAAGEQRAVKEKKRCEKRFVPFLWTVFNIDQVEGIDFRLPPFPERTDLQLIDACQRVVDNYPSPRPRILHGGTQAWYAPALDTVQVPELKRFTSPEAYHATLFHELIHSTGHPSRLNRFTEAEKASRFGDEAYSKEELVAEMGASFLCAFTGIREAVFQNTVAYLQGWVSRLREDHTLVIYAGTKAFKAASYVLDMKSEADNDAPPAAKEAA